ncbi:MAG: bifunctional DNA primase/polymerase [Actinomycetota bacterium]
MSSVDDALRDLELGPIVPLFPDTKKPAAGMGWPDKALRHKHQVIAWWTAHPGANHGILCEGLAVLDVDVKDARMNGMESLDTLKKQKRDLPATRVVETASGGAHYYYRAPRGGVATKVNFLPGLERRALNAQTVGAGSVVDGSTYRSFRPSRSRTRRRGSSTIRCWTSFAEHGAKLTTKRKVWPPSIEQRAIRGG